MNVRRSVPMDVKVRKRTNLMGITPLRFAQPPQPQEAVPGQEGKQNRQARSPRQDKTEALLTNSSGATSRLVFKQKARQLDN